MKAITENHIKYFIKKAQKSTVSDEDTKHFLQYFDTPEKIEIFNKYRITHIENDKKYGQPIIHWLISQNQSGVLSKIIDANIFDHNVKNHNKHTPIQFIVTEKPSSRKQSLFTILLNSKPVNTTLKLYRSQLNIIGCCLKYKNISLLISILQTLIDAQRKEDIITLIKDSNFDLNYSKRYMKIIKLLKKNGMSDVLKIIESQAISSDKTGEPKEEIAPDSESSNDIDIRKASDQIPPLLEHLQQALLESDPEINTALPIVLEYASPQELEVYIMNISDYLDKHKFGFTIYQELCHREIDDHLTQHRLSPFVF